jgi:hypothetical protein
MGFEGFCPETLDYAATITVDHVPTDISYTWIDGTSAGLATLHVTHSPVMVTRSLTPADTTMGDISLEVVSPSSVVSNTVHFNVLCTHVTIGHATTNPPAYTGSCVRRITFTTTVPVTVTNGPLVLSYRWVRSDGAVSSVQTAFFGHGTSTQDLTFDWTQSNSSTVGAPDNDWVQLQIVGTPGGVSNQSSFAIWCV